MSQFVFSALFISFAPEKWPGREMSQRRFLDFGASDRGCIPPFFPCGCPRRTVFQSLLKLSPLFRIDPSALRIRPLRSPETLLAMTFLLPGAQKSLCFSFFFLTGAPRYPLDVKPMPMVPFSSALVGFLRLVWNLVSPAPLPPQRVVWAAAGAAPSDRLPCVFGFFFVVGLPLRC